MSEGLNRVMLLGNLGADPELRFTQGGQAVCHIRMACTESYLDKDKQRAERTEWVNVTIWGKRGEALSKILAKGSSVFVEGSLRTSSYDNREGQKVWKTEVVANNVILAGGRGGGGEAGSGGGRPRRDDDGYAPQGRSEGGGYSRGGGNGGGAARAPQDPADAADAGGFGTDDDVPFVCRAGCGPWRV